MDAARLRNRVIQRYEEAKMDPAGMPDSKLTFVVIGGGATGVREASKI
jgi:NADH dehydrogenase